MKKIVCHFTVITALFCLFSPNVKAMHIIGGEITYEMLDSAAAGILYRFTMKIYRDCNGGGAPFDTRANIAIYRGTINSNILITNFATDPPSQSGVQAEKPECIAEIPPVCVEQAVYTFERRLPVSAETYYVVYQRCCRNVTINNVLTPGDIGATYFVEITGVAQKYGNNSPVFKKFPPSIICSNYPLMFDHSAIDKDGDLLVYSFCSPYTGGGKILSGSGASSCDGAVPNPPCSPPFEEVSFVNGYNAQSPAGGAPRVMINPGSGMITGTPNKLGQFVVGVCVQEFRNGELLSTLRRDFQFNVANCKPTVVADIEEDSLAGPRQYLITSCGSNTVTFVNQSRDRSKITFFEWQFNIKGTEYKDSQNWDATIKFPDTGLYKGRLLLNPGSPCSDTAYIAVNVFPKVHSDFSYLFDTCTVGPVSFKEKATGIAGIKNWRWTFGATAGLSNELNPNYQYSKSGLYSVILRVTDQNNCKDDTTQVVGWYPAPTLVLIEPSTFSGCAPADVFFKNLSAPIDSTYKILWSFGDGTTAKNIISPTHRYEKPGLYDVGIAITSPYECFISDTFPNLIRMDVTPTADFAFDPDSMLSNLNNRLQFIDRSIDAFRWEWLLGRNGKSTLQNPVYTFPDTGKTTVRLIVSHPGGCRDTLLKILDIRPEIRWFMPNAFTPNGDGTNEAFLGRGMLFGARSFSLSVWNRWGEQVFESNDPDTGWDGRSKNGNASPAGVYVYVVKITGPRGEPMEFKGYATLVK